MKDTNAGHKVLFVGYNDTMYNALGTGYRIQIKDKE